MVRIRLFAMEDKLKMEKPRRKQAKYKFIRSVKIIGIYYELRTA
jgi:hypothetical protein